MSQIESRYAWFLVGVSSVFMGMAAGSILSISVFLKPLVAEFGWLRAQTALGYTAGALTMGVGGIVMGYLSDRFSTRSVVLGGVAFLGLSLALLATQSSLTEFYIYYCILGGLGAAALDVPLLANVGHWFERNKGLALGIATAGRGLGQGLVPFLAGLLIADYGWREAYFALAVVAVMVLLPLAWIVRSPPGLEEAKGVARRVSVEAQRKAFAIEPKTAVAWISAAAVFCCACMGTAMVHSVALARDAGIDEKSAAGIVLMIYVSGFFGRIAFGKLADYIGGPRAYLAASAIQTSLIFWFTQISGLASFYTLAILLGFGMNAVMTCLMVCVREMTPIHIRGVSIGIVFLFGWIGMGLGGYQGGYFFDLTGSYTVSYANAAFAGIINMVIVGSLVYYAARARARLVAAPAALAT
jgi:MFS family permease